MNTDNFRNSFQINMYKKNSNRCKFKHELASWCSRWNRLLAAILGLIVFVVMFSVVVIFTVNGEPPANNGTKEFLGINPSDQVNLSKKSLIASPKTFCHISPSSNCEVDCSDIGENEIGNVAGYITEAVKASCITSTINLIFSNVKFEKSTIENGWLSSLDPCISVTDLTINSSSLTNIGTEAFAGRPFENLLSLTIVDCPINVLESGIFLDSTINTFQFRFNRMSSTILVEAGAFDGIENHLTTLQFNQCLNDPDALQNITGSNGSQLNLLVILDLRNNFLTKITDKSFENAPRLQSLYLNQNSLKELDVQAFVGIENIIDLQFAQNDLKTLPEGLFNGFSGHGTIHIENNHYICNCDLVWFRDFYEESSYFNNIVFECDTDRGNVNYKSVDFCSDDSTTSTPSSTEPTETTTKDFTSSHSPIETSTGTSSTTDESTTISSTTNKESTSTPDPTSNFVTIPCHNSQLLGIKYRNPTRTYLDSITVRKGQINYNFYQIDDTPAFEIVIYGNVSKDYMILRIDENGFSQCIQNLMESVILDNLDYGKSYTICLLQSNEKLVSPDDCTSLSVPEIWSKQAWIVNSTKVMAVIVVCGVTILVAIITGFVVFYFIRQHPQLIKGNKRVVIVGKKSAEVLIMPQYNKNSCNTRLSNGTLVDGYLTPIYNVHGSLRWPIYEQVNKNCCVPSISESCCSSQCSSGLRSYKIRQRNPIHPVQLSCESTDSEAPPLPPNHPREQSQMLKPDIYAQI